MKDTQGSKQGRVGGKVSKKERKKGYTRKQARN